VDLFTCFLICGNQRPLVNFGGFGEGNLVPLGKRGGIPQCLHNIFLFKVGIIREKFLAADPLANLTNDHTEEKWKIQRSQNVIFNKDTRKYKPYVFTEQGVSMLSSVINSKRAIEVNINIMRVFVPLFTLHFSFQCRSLLLPRPLAFSMEIYYYNNTWATALKY